MADTILAVSLAQKAEYSLSDVDRAALLAQTRAGKRALLIERQRNTFMARYGDAFGQASATNSNAIVSLEMASLRGLNFCSKSVTSQLPPQRGNK
ncbi:hypothetical protein [Propionivibrio soli]|uniref:hypothetical protein n=1 Tax=Propionivibrio soli TaxID=2976531 RepID=UPI0021E74E2D|nr:hypothetical protein [Propionivibrio soli]